MKNLIFLDIDGVLNGHNLEESSPNGRLNPFSVKQLNRIIEQTNSEIVIISTWRKIIDRGDMNFRGFEKMLATHGAPAVHDKIIGITPIDCATLPLEKRAIQINTFLQIKESVVGKIYNYIIIDDCQSYYVGRPDFNGRCVFPNGLIGMQPHDADKAISLLTK